MARWERREGSVAIRQPVERDIEGVRTVLYGVPQYDTVVQGGNFYCAALASTREVTGQARPCMSRCIRNCAR
jgi:hypothetical protein